MWLTGSVFSSNIALIIRGYEAIESLLTSPLHVLIKVLLWLLLFILKSR